MKLRTKIVCTLGPASWDIAILRKMVKAGMTVVRANGAFVDIATLKMIQNNVRFLTKDVALMLDIKGSDVRLNNFAKPIELKINADLIIGSGESDYLYPINYPGLYQDLKKGDLLFFDDGLVKAEVLKIKEKKIFTKVLAGHQLKPGKSINTPGIKLDTKAVTQTDKEQIQFCAENGWDFVAASYIRDAQDASYVKKSLKNTPMQMIAKIEEGQGVENIHEIMSIADGIMVARGDMGVELPIEKLTAIQKMLIRKANQAGKPVITATQMLESMIEKPIPTRAEISDIANAVLDGTDAIMSSGETTIGKYPVEVVETLVKVAAENEKYLTPAIMKGEFKGEDKIVDSMSRATFELSQGLELDALLVATHSGRSARLIARHNPSVNIHAFASNPNVVRQLNLTRAINPHLLKREFKTRADMIDGIISRSLELGIIKKGSRVLVMGKVPKMTSKYRNVFEYVEV